MPDANGGVKVTSAGEFPRTETADFTPINIYREICFNTFLKN